MIDWKKYGWLDSKKIKHKIAVLPNQNVYKIVDMHKEDSYRSEPEKKYSSLQVIDKHS